MKNNAQEPPKALENLETNPLFPSGEWEGFFTYAFGPDARRHMMSFALTFKNGKVSGSGIDNVDRFIWRGVTIRKNCAAGCKSDIPATQFPTTDMLTKKAS